MTRCVVVPSIAVSMIKDWSHVRLSMDLYKFEQMIEELKVCKEVVNFIRHKPTTDLIIKFVGRSDVKSGFEYVLDTTDVIYIVGLKGRTPVSGADIPVKPEDLLVYRVWVDVATPTVREG